MKLSVKIRVNQLANVPFPILVEAQDDNGRTVPHYAGKVRFLVSGDIYGSPGDFSFADKRDWLPVSIKSWLNAAEDYYEFYPVQGGRTWIGAFDMATETLPIAVSAPGLYVICAVDDSGARGRSNPFLVTEKPAKDKIFFGDLHGHVGEQICGIGTIDHYYTYAQHTAGLDFCALSDHDITSEVNRKNLFAIWDKIKAAAEYWNRPGEIVTLLGYEWSCNSDLGGEGHKNVYFPDGKGRMFPADEKRSATLEGLCACLEKMECLVIPHHPAAPSYWSTNWEHHDPRRQRLVEIYSIWGSSEIPDAPDKPFRIRMGTSWKKFKPGTSVIEALERGYRLGFTGGGDTHDCKPGQSWAQTPLTAREKKRWEGTYRNGLQGVWTTDLSRPAIWEAMMQRRVYATTGERIIVEYWLNEKPMGSVIEEPSNERALYCKVIGTAPVREIAIVKNGRVVHSAAGDKLEWLDKSPERAEDYYYARITQADGNMAWASPIWIKG